MLGVYDPEHTSSISSSPIMLALIRRQCAKSMCPWTLLIVDYTYRAPIFVLGDEINDKAAAYRFSTPFTTKLDQQVADQ